MTDIYELANTHEYKLWEATLHNDKVAFNSLVERDAVMVCGNHRCLGSEYVEYLENELMQSYDFLAFEVVQSTDDFIQVHYVVKVESIDNEFAGEFHVTSTWKKIGENYKLVFNMDSRILN